MAVAAGWTPGCAAGWAVITLFGRDEAGIVSVGGVHEVVWVVWSM
jgi:hypothetical protein